MSMGTVEEGRKSEIYRWSLKKMQQDIPHQKREVFTPRA